MQDGQQGQVIKPGDQALAPVELPNLPQTADAETAPTESPTPPQATPEPAFTQEPQRALSGTAHVEWTASEYIANTKSIGWFATLVAASIVLAVVAYLVTKDVVSAVVILVLGVLVGVFAARQPQVLEYKIDSTGIQVGNKLYPYISFKSFSVSHEHAIGYISLMPLKRFMPPLTIHYAPDDEDVIAETLADYLPYEDHKADVVDNLSRRLRF